MAGGVSRRTLVKLASAGAALSAARVIGAPAVWGQGAAGTIKLVSVTSLSGGFARYGQELERGIDIALDKITPGREDRRPHLHDQEETFDDKMTWHLGEAGRRRSPATRRTWCWPASARHRQGVDPGRPAPGSR
jgi:hypothetical protein